MIPADVKANKNKKKYLNNLVELYLTIFYKKYLASKLEIPTV